jgi:hypothetical protein
MVRSMMGLKRKPIFDSDNNRIGFEPWLDFYKRSMSRAKAVIKEMGFDMNKLIWSERERWAKHIARMGCNGKKPSLIKGLIGWRNKYWWQFQQTWNLIGGDQLYHLFPFKPMRWEEHLPNDWLCKFSNEDD